MANATESAFGLSIAMPALERKDPTAHLARELHDGVAGELSTMLVDLERFRAGQVGRQSVLSEIGKLQEQLRFVLANVRRLVYDQRNLPGIEPDFVGSLRRGLLRRFIERTGLRIHVSVGRSWPADIPADTALNLRRIIQESLNNVDRHSGARSVLVRFDVPPGSPWGYLRVSDDGRRAAESVDEVQPGLGLVGIEERALLIGGRVALSNRPRGGSVLSVSIPRRSLAL